MEYPKHIVAVMGLVRNSEGKLLLVRTPRRGWEPPGGQVENGEDLLAALKREIWEESGIVVKGGKLVALYSNIAHPTKLMLTFEAIAVNGTLQTSTESVEVGWFSPEEALEKVTHPAQRQKLQDALNNRGIVYRVYKTNPYELLQTVNV
ncbi:NUDIX domain-containing protein [Candidatus Poribacteria bacterium]|nr:NUDIX domain-containing protein [Candidatus Poribacteria bacterium]